jgi:uncharacterized LabA/DUF88 family protein
MERVCVFIDGGNFHHLVLKKLSVQELDFSFDKFALFLANGREVIGSGKRFYVGTVREIEGSLRSKEAMAKQTELFTLLKNDGWEIKTSKLRMRREKLIIDDRVIGYQDLLKKGIKQIESIRTREKGIDVKLATDLIVGAVDNQYDTAILVSSDGDLIPAVDWIRRRRSKRVEYVGFSIEDQGDRSQNTRPLQSMINRSDIQRILVVSDIKPFVSELSERPLVSPQG